MADAADGEVAEGEVEAEVGVRHQVEREGHLQTKKCNLINIFIYMLMIR